MSPSAPAYAAHAVLQSIRRGYRDGCEATRAARPPRGTLSPAPRRRGAARPVRSGWEDHRLARRAQRRPRKYYEITGGGEEALAPAVARCRLLDPPGRRRRLSPAKT